MNLVSEYDLGMVKNRVKDLEHQIQELTEKVEASTQVLDAIRKLIESRSDK